MSVYNAATGVGPFPAEYLCPKCGSKATASSHTHVLVDGDGNPVSKSDGNPSCVWMPIGYRCSSCGLIFCHICNGNKSEMVVRVKGMSQSMAMHLEGKVMRR